MSIAATRIKRDLDELREQKDSWPIIFGDTVDDGFYHIEACVHGPPSTPYENGVFLIGLKLPEEFPFRPPLSVTFKRATMHPNVDESGRFMSDLLTTTTWLPTMTIRNILEHVWARLAFPDIDSAQCDATRAHLYRTDKALFEAQARDYSIKYAQAT